MTDTNIVLPLTAAVKQDVAKSVAKRSLDDDSASLQLFNSSNAQSPYNPYDTRDFDMLFNEETDTSSPVEVNNNDIEMTISEKNKKRNKLNKPNSLQKKSLSRANTNSQTNRNREFGYGISEGVSYRSLSSSSRDRRASSDTESEALSCGASNCTRLVCVVEDLEAGEHIVVRVQARLWVDTIEAVSLEILI